VPAGDDQMRLAAPVAALSDGKDGQQDEKTHPHCFAGALQVHLVHDLGLLGGALVLKQVCLPLWQCPEGR